MRRYLLFIALLLAGTTISTAYSFDESDSSPGKKMLLQYIAKKKRMKMPKTVKTNFLNGSVEQLQHRRNLDESTKPPLSSSTRAPRGSSTRVPTPSSPSIQPPSTSPPNLPPIPKVAGAGESSSVLLQPVTVFRSTLLILLWILL